MEPSEKIKSVPYISTLRYRVWVYSGGGRRRRRRRREKKRARRAPIGDCLPEPPKHIYFYIFRPGMILLLVCTYDFRKRM